MSRISKYVKIITRRLLNINYLNFRLINLTNYSEIGQRITVEQLLINEGLYTSRFNRYDIIVRYLAIENYYNLNDYGYYLYEKMQKKRIAQIKKLSGRTYNLDNFLYLIQNYKKIINKEIYLTKRLKLLDGSHRLALALYNNEKWVNFRISKLDYNDIISYGINWFEENDFSESEISLIQSKYNDIKNKAFVKTFIAIIWCRAFAIHKQIEEEIAKKYKITNTKQIDIADKNQLDNFIRMVYECQNIPEKRVMEKVEYNYINAEKNKVYVIEFQINNAVYRNNDFNIRDSKVIYKLKKQLRKKYKKFVKNYTYDNLIHIYSNDTESQNFAQKVFNKDCLS